MRMSSDSDEFKQPLFPRQLCLTAHVPRRLLATYNVARHLKTFGG
jgi:hypothetical protein